MFDWNDEELTNIIWGEATEGEDHIVPYADGSQEKPPDLYGDHIKKEQNQEAVDTRTSEQKKPVSRTDLKLEGTSQYVINQSLETTEFTVDSWPNLSLPSSAKAEQDSLGTEVSNDVTDISNHETRSEQKAVRRDNASEIFQSPLDDSEQGDFVDYSWANVGSFEDLDRIFSNDDPIFGHASLGSSEELWSSSKNVTSSPEKSLPLSVDSPSLGVGELKSTSEPLEVKADYLPDEKSLGSDLNLFTSNASGDSNSCIENTKYAIGRSTLSVKQKTAMEMVGGSTVFDLPIDAGSATTTDMNKGNLQKKLKGRKKEEQSEIRHLQDLHRGWTHTGNQFVQYDSQFASAVSQPGSSIVFSQKLQFQAPESSQYQNFPSPMATLMHGSIAKQYAPLPILSRFPSAEGTQQPVPTNYKVSPGNVSKLNKSAEAPTLVMTPQEKIEKLRRRQQMRAMLAIQKQQQQFGNQISSSEYSGMEGEHIEAEEIPSSLPSFDPNSSTEQDDSSTFSAGRDEWPLQDSILHRLQEIVGKLDIHIRLCIRDSLFRLAQSARQRQHSGDTSSSNKCDKDEVLRKDETGSHTSTCHRFPKVAAVETETNPIDRSVAHLLFYRPPEMAGKPFEAPDSPLSAKMLPFKRKETGLNLVPHRPENKQTLPQDESKVPIIFTDGDGVQNSLHHLSVPENKTKKGSIDGVSKIEPPSEG